MKLISLCTLLLLTQQQLHESAALPFKLPFKFSAKAELDSKTGLATSFESSTYTRHLKSTNLHLEAEKVFAFYPKYVGLKRVCFGALKAKEVAGGDNGEEKHVHLCLPLPFVKIPLLIFGAPVTTKSKVQTERRIVTEIPVVGGLLACKRAGTNTSAGGKMQSILLADVKHKVNDVPVVGPLLVILGGKKLRNKKVDHYGKLRLEFIQELDTSKAKTLGTNARIETQLVDYRPGVAGFSPIHPIRKRAYAAIQQPIHSYVMFRFHTYCYAVMLTESVAAIKAVAKVGKVQKLGQALGFAKKVTSVV
jgi:hypothetical protein